MDAYGGIILLLLPATSAPVTTLAGMPVPVTTLAGMPVTTPAGMPVL